MRISLFSLGFILVTILPLVAQSKGPQILRQWNSQGTYANPRAVRLGHFVGDTGPIQYLDAVQLAEGDNRLEVWRGDGRGSLYLLRYYNVSAQPRALDVGDINGDKKLDVVIVYHTANAFQVGLGAGNGTFAFKPLVKLGVKPHGVVLTDIDGDGLLDAAVVVRSLSRMYWLKGDGKGAFTLQTAFTVTGKGPIAIKAADLNGDKRMDLLSTDYEGDTISVMLGDGKGSFAVTRVQAGKAPHASTLADFDGDGDLDVAVAVFDSNEVRVFHNNGKAGFVLASTSLVGSNPTGVDAGDLNGDGKADIAVTSYRNATVSLLLNRGLGTFPAKTESVCGVTTNPRDLCIGDLNNDGRNDLAVSCYGAKRLNTLVNDPTGANRIVNLWWERGRLNQGAFVSSNWHWDTVSGRYSNQGYYLGVTHPGKSRSFLNNSNSTINLASDSAYWVWMDRYAPHGGPAVRFQIQWGSGFKEWALFTPSCYDGAKGEPFYRHSGSRRIEIETVGLGAVDRIHYDGLYPNGRDDWVFQVKIHSKEPPARIEKDFIDQITIQTGTYDNHSSSGRNFRQSTINYWDTYGYGGRGSFLGVTEPGLGKKILNCSDSQVSLVPDKDYWVLMDLRYTRPSRVYRVNAHWASGKNQWADFHPSCPESKEASFMRLQGSRQIELGRTGYTGTDRVAWNYFGSNGYRDDVFKIRVHSEEPPKKALSDRVRSISLRAGKWENQAFVGQNSYIWTNWWPVNSYILGFKGLNSDSLLLCLEDYRVTLGSGTYRMYVDASQTLRTALQVSVQWASDGRVEDAVFQTGDVTKRASWKWLAGSKNIRLVCTGKVEDRMGYRSATPNGVKDYIFELTLFAQGWSSFGIGCKGSGGIPEMSAKLAPNIGKTFRLTLDKLKPASVAVMMLGREANLTLDALGAPGCVLLSNPTMSFPLSTGTGSGVPWSLSIPNWNSLIGYKLVNQAFILDAAVNKLGLVFSNGGLGVIGG